MVDRYGKGWDGLLNIYGYVILRGFCCWFYLNFLFKWMLKNIWLGCIVCDEYLLIGVCLMFIILFI